jgi:hypothetical protein
VERWQDARKVSTEDNEMARSYLSARSVNEITRDSELRWTDALFGARSRGEGRGEREVQD